MNALSSLCYLLLAFLMAAYCEQVCCRNMRRNEIFRLLALFIVFSAVFFGGFLFLGFLELLTGRPLVHPLWGCMVLGVAACIVRVALKPANLDLLRVVPLRAILSAYQGIPGSPARVLVTATVGFFAIASVFCVMQFPEGFEPKAYHLPIAVRTFQQQTLTVWGTGFMHAYPANASILFGFLLLALPERLVSAANLLFVIPLLIALYGLALQTGASRQAALISSLGILSIPIIAVSVFQLGSDIGGLTYLAIAAYFVVHALLGARQGLFLAGLAAGLAFGFKSLHLVGMTFLTLSLLCAKRDGPSGGNAIEPVWARVRAAGVFLVGVVALAGFWLTRNFVELDNPLYPVSLPVISSLLGWAEAPDVDLMNRLSTQYEWVRSSWEWPLYPWIEWHYIEQNFKHSSGFGLFFAAMVPVSFLASLAAVIWDRGRTILVFHVLGAIFVLAIWWLMGDRQPRYLLGAFVFLMPLVSWTLAQPAELPRKAWCGLAVASIIIMFLLVGMKLTMAFGAKIIYAKRFDRFAYYLYPSVIDKLPPGSRILNFARRTWNYPLYGKHLQNEVIDYIDSGRQFRLSSRKDSRQGPNSITLNADKVKAVGATHLFVMGSPKIILEGAISVRELSGLDQGLVLGGEVDRRALYAIDLGN